MSCDFKVGDEVVCVDDTVPTGRFWQISRWPLQKGIVHTVIEVLSPEEFHRRAIPHPLGKSWATPKSAGLVLADIQSPTGTGFGARRFRKVQRRDLTAWLATENTIEGPLRTKEHAR